MCFQQTLVNSSTLRYDQKWVDYSKRTEMKKILALLITTIVLASCMSKEEYAIRLLAKAHLGDLKPEQANFKILKTTPQEFFDNYYSAKDSNSKQIKQYLGNSVFIEGIVNKVDQKQLFFYVNKNQHSGCGIRADAGKSKNKFSDGDNVRVWLVVKSDSIDLNEVKNTCILTVQLLDGFTVDKNGNRIYTKVTH